MHCLFSCAQLAASLVQNFVAVIALIDLDVQLILGASADEVENIPRIIPTDAANFQAHVPTSKRYYKVV